MRALALLLSLAAAGFASEARAQPADTGFTLGARLGYALPMGDAAKPGGQSFALKDYVSGQVPIEVEAGYRFTREISAGLYFGYGFAFASSKVCDQFGPLPTGVSCSASGASVMRYGIQGAYRFIMPGMTPWLGLGIGMEQAKLDVKASGFGASQTSKFEVSGWEYLNLQGGVDWDLSPGFKVGPFARVSIAKYDTAKLDGTKQDLPSSDQSIHEWLTIGVKGTFDL